MASWLNLEVVLVRVSRRLVRTLRRVGTRIFLAGLHAELEELRQRQDRLERQLHALQGKSCDQTALSRRLAMLEDRLLEAAPADAPLPAKG